MKWIEQWERVLRWYARISRTNEGREHTDGTDSYQDEVYAFFQNYFHLKDWIKNDSSVPSDIRGHVEDFMFGPADDRGKGCGERHRGRRGDVTVMIKPCRAVSPAPSVT
jgi:hypothetical protein